MAIQEDIQKRLEKSSLRLNELLEGIVTGKFDLKSAEFKKMKADADLEHKLIKAEIKILRKSKKK